MNSKYKLVEATLRALNFKDEILDAFIAQEITDTRVGKCLSKPFLAELLAEVIQPAGKRMDFLDKFSDLKKFPQSNGKKTTKTKVRKVQSLGDINKTIDLTNSSEEEDNNDGVLCLDTLVI
ncbi:unnamed protein product, partial [Allacma fusca]